ncbi:MAG: flavodoxin, partial [Acidimicrobiia bacterium]|nr:flavodoxin [Acidimicrobiia bacterium]
SETDQPLVSPDIGLREWIRDLPKVSGVAAATFDTSIRKPNLPGSAARGAQKRLKRLGYRMLLPAEIFRVEGATGPITDGELDRARAWGQHLADTLPVHS